MTAPTLEASVAHAGNPTTAPTLTFGATVAGDILLAFFTNGGSDSDPTLSGTTITTGGLTWTKKTSIGGGALTDLNGSLWWARATGNHNGQTVIGATTNSGSAVGGVVRGCPASGDPFDNATTVLNASGVNAHTGFTPSVDECLILLFLATDDNIASDTYACTGSPSTLTERQDATSSGGVDTAAAFASGVQTTAAAIGVVTWNNARGAGVYQGVVLAALKPAIAKSGTGTITASSSLTGSGTKAGSGVGSVSSTATLAGSQSTTRSGSGTVANPTALTGDGGRGAADDGAITATSALTVTGRKDGSGISSVSAATSTSGAGTAARQGTATIGATGTITGSGSGSQGPQSGSGSGTITATTALTGSGSGTGSAVVAVIRSHGPAIWDARPVILPEKIAKSGGGRILVSTVISGGGAAARIGGARLIAVARADDGLGVADRTWFEARNAEDEQLLLSGGL